MKVATTVQYVEVEVDISLEDIVCAISEETDKLPMVMRGISNSHQFLKAIPDSIIAGMNDKQKAIIYTALLEQVQRYVVAGHRIENRREA
jgi:hypothetical protein